jgi:hypothetical protein
LQAILEPAMYKMLVIGLFTACLVNAASLVGHIVTSPVVTTGLDRVAHAERPLVKEALAYRRE